MPPFELQNCQTLQCESSGHDYQKTEMRPAKKKQCKVCPEKFTPMNSLQQVCSPKCAIAFNSKKEVNKRVREMRKEVQSLADLRAIARAAFQTYIRMRDAKMPCISCGKTEAKWDASHYYKAEVYTGLIFDEENCHKACSWCNQHLDGNLIEYRKGLVKKIGRLNVELLEARAGFSRVYKFSKDELKEIADRYKQKIKELKQAA